MKAVAVAVAAVGIIGGVKADGWETWATTASSDPAKTSTTSSASTTTSSASSSASASSTVTWGEWDPTTTVSSSVKPVTTASSSTESWGEWDEVTTYTTETGTVTVTKTITPIKSKASSTVSVSSSTTSSSTVSVVTSTVSPVWSHGGWFGGAWPTAASGQCVMNVVTSYGHAIWKPTPGVSSSSSTTSSKATTTPSAASTSSAAQTWAEWASSSSAAATSAKVDPSTAATENWGAWTSSAAAGGFYTASASSAKASSTGSSGGKGGAGISTNGDSWAMTYTPYTASGGCKDAGTIAADMAKLASKGFTSVRVYSTDCSTLQFVGAAARANNIKLILGVFISSTGIAGAQSQVNDIAQWAQWDIVSLIVVGNEAIFNGYCNAGELAGFITSSKAIFAGAGYTGSVTTTEDLATWQANGSTLCGVVDVVAANLYAFFNPNTRAEDAGTFIQAEIAELAAICGNKDTYVMESGWPSAGSCNGVACPGVAEQATAIKAIQGAVGSKIVFFSFEDELWKTSGQFGVEQHWGCANVF